MFDRQKLVWMNNQYVKKLDLEQVVELSLPHLVKAERIPENPTAEEMKFARKLIALYQEQMSFGAEIVELSEQFFKEEVVYDEAGLAILKGETVPDVLRAFLQEIESMEPYEAVEIKASIKRVQKATGQKGKNLFMPIRVAVSGQEHGPDLASTIEILGKAKVAKRLQDLLN